VSVAYRSYPAAWCAGKGSCPLLNNRNPQHAVQACGDQPSHNLLPRGRQLCSQVRRQCVWGHTHPAANSVGQCTQSLNTTSTTHNTRHKGLQPLRPAVKPPMISMGSFTEAVAAYGILFPYCRLSSSAPQCLFRAVQVRSESHSAAAMYTDRMGGVIRSTAIRQRMTQSFPPLRSSPPL
jgi:hypothetical protein